VIWKVADVPFLKRHIWDYDVTTSTYIRYCAAKPTLLLC